MSALRSRDEFFDKLAKTTIKAQHVEELNHIKAELELKDCTFKPIIRDKSRDVSKEPMERSAHDLPTCAKNQDEVWKRLYVENMESKNWEKIEKEKAMLELRECTFSPHIN